MMLIYKFIYFSDWKGMGFNLRKINYGERLTSVPQFYFYSLWVTKAQMLKTQFEHFKSDWQSGLLEQESLVKQSVWKNWKRYRKLVFLVENPNQSTNWSSSQPTKITHETCSTGKNQNLGSTWGGCYAFPICTTEPNTVLSMIINQMLLWQTRK